MKKMCILVWTKGFTKKYNLKKHLYQFKCIPGIEIPELENFHAVAFVWFKSENHFNLFVLLDGLPDWISWQYEKTENVN